MRRCEHGPIGPASVHRCEDAHAAALLWHDAGVRREFPSRIDGNRQAAIRNRAELEGCSQDIGADNLRTDGVVLDRDLRGVEALSGGRTLIGALAANYCDVP